MNPHTIHVPAKQLHDHWPFVRRGLEAIRKKTKPEWLAEDIYSAIRQGNAMLLLAMCGPNPVGFTISYFTEVPFSNRKELFVWAAWTIPPRERLTGWPVQAAINDNFDTLVRLARAEGAFRLSCLSPRPGFGGWAKQFGFRHYLSSYERLL